MRILDLTKNGSMPGAIRPDQEYVEFIEELMTPNGDANAVELDDRAHDVCLSVSMYEVLGDDYGEQYPDGIILDMPSSSEFLDRIKVWANTCFLEVIWKEQRHE